MTDAPKPNFSIVDCAVFRAESNCSVELMLCIAPRDGRHPVQKVENAQTLTWACADGRLESAGIAPEHPDHVDVLREITGDGLLIAEFADRSDVVTREQVLAGVADRYWVLSSDIQPSASANEVTLP